MSVHFEVLGRAGCDNAVFVKVDSGQSVHRLLFDCGDGCVNTLALGEIQAIDHLFFSHFHMDHVAGFDQFFRCNFSRSGRPNVLWGPVGSAAILQHRFQGFTWNLAQEMQGTWIVREISPSGVHEFRFELTDGFEVLYTNGRLSCGERILETDTWTVNAWSMNHRTSSIAYLVTERPRENFRAREIEALGLIPGPWLKQLRSVENSPDTVIVQGREWSREYLREKLIEVTPGSSVAYLTDFIMDESAMKLLGEKLSGCDTIICESQYRHVDLELATRSFHMTGVLAARLAARANAKHLLLFHLSDRYSQQDWREMLREAQAVFPATTFASQWNLNP